MAPFTASVLMNLPVMMRTHRSLPESLHLVLNTALAFLFNVAYFWAICLFSQLIFFQNKHVNTLVRQKELAR